MTVKAVVDTAFDVGCFQHRDELTPFAEWLMTINPERILEIGALHGGTSALFCLIANSTVVSVDKPDGRFGGADHQYNEAKCFERNGRLQNQYPGQFVGVVGDSHDFMTAMSVTMALAGEKVDLLFIDGDHTVDGVTQDYEQYKDFVRPGGYIAFHDINDTAVHRAAGCMVHELWQKIVGEKIEFNIHADWGGIGVVRC